MTPDYIMVGGFLGAGKTNAILRLARRLTEQGRRVGVITNDQSEGLVDTTLVSAHGYASAEITGGCVCCRFHSLTEAADRLMRDARPDVFLAEPVGSCTDLHATVQYPLRRMYGENYRVAPLSVLVDPVRAARVLGLEVGRTFSPKVQYVYEKQLEEAEIIVVNKLDVLDDARRDALGDALRSRFPKADLHFMSARTGDGVDAWCSRVAGAGAEGSATTFAPTMDLDYDLYAEGEALLGWLNLTCRVTAVTPSHGNEWLARLGAAIHGRLHREDIEIAHFKMTLSPDSGRDLAVLNIVRSDGRRESVHRLEEPLAEGEAIVNLRAEADPEPLHSLVAQSLDEIARETGVTVEVQHREHFRPGRPQTTHRMVVA